MYQAEIEIEKREGAAPTNYGASRGRGACRARGDRALSPVHQARAPRLRSARTRIRDVRRDLETFMADLAPDGDPRFVHTAEGPDDMPAHVRSVLTGRTSRFPCATAGSRSAPGKACTFGSTAFSRIGVAWW